jgi:uncharacterized protein (TIGR02145 family)
MRNILFFLFFLSLFSCKKDFVNSEVSINDFKIIDSTNLSVKVSFKLDLKGKPQILEKGIIASVDADAGILNQRFEDTNSIEDLIVMNLINLDGNTKYYLRPYVITSKDTILGSIKTYSAKSYYKAGAGVYDVDDNFYPTVILGNQEWMGTNLRTTRFSNGDLITKIDSISSIISTSPVWCNFNFENQNDLIYGKLYNGHVILDERNVCPSGYHIPNNEDWGKLLNYLGGAQFFGGKLKSAGTLQEGTGLWEYPNNKGTNASGLNFLPGGVTFDNGTFYGLGKYCYYSRIDFSYSFETGSQGLGLYYHASDYELIGGAQHTFTYVRCLKD